VARRSAIATERATSIDAKSGCGDPLLSTRIGFMRNIHVLAALVGLAIVALVLYLARII
jgi:hypothetical protein